MEIEPKNFKTVHNFCLQEKITPSYIYRLIRSGIISALEIDGFKFIDTTQYANIRGVVKAYNSQKKLNLK